MKNLFDAARVEEVKQRIGRLRPDSQLLRRGANAAGSAEEDFPEPNPVGLRFRHGVRSVISIRQWIVLLQPR